VGLADAAGAAGAVESGGSTAAVVLGAGVSGLFGGGPAHAQRETSDVRSEAR